MDDPFDPDPTFDDAPGGATVVAPKKQTAREQDKHKIPRYHVVLWDSDDHSYEYVIRMLHELFGHTKEQCFKLAETVDTHGKATVLTTTKEHAELKRDQIIAYGTDQERANVGSMHATIESE